MKSKKVFALWLLTFGGCNTVVKQNIGLEDTRAVVDTAVQAASSAVRVTLNVVSDVARDVGICCADALHDGAHKFADVSEECARRASDVSNALRAGRATKG